VLLLSLCEVWAATNYLITQENTVLQAKSFFANHASHDAIQGTFDMSKVSKSYQKLDLSNYHKDNSELLSQYGVLDKKKMIFSDKKNIDIVSDKDHRKLTGSFTCQSGWTSLSPFSLCSDVVDYSYLLLDSTTVAALEADARALLPSSTMGFISNTCLSDYKRMICAKVYAPCVDNVISGDTNTYDPVTTLPYKLPCKSLCDAASNAGTTCGGLLEGLGVTLDCTNAALFDTNSATCNALTSTDNVVTVAPHVEPYIGSACAGVISQTYLGATSGIAEIPGLAPLLPPWVQQTLIEATVAPIFENTPRYLTHDCLLEEKRFFCSLKYMAPQEITGLAFLFGANTVYMPQFPSQNMCQAYTSTCAAAFVLAPALAFDCATEVAPSTPLFPETTVTLGVFPLTPFGMSDVYLTTNARDLQLSDSYAIETQCPFGFTTDTIDGADPERYTYMMTPELSDCKYECPKLGLYTKENYDSFDSFQFWCWLFCIPLSILVITNMLTHDSEKRNNYVFYFSCFFLFQACLITIFLMTYTGPSPGCETNLFAYDGSVNNFSSMFVVPIALCRSANIYVTIFVSTCISLEVWIRVYWKVKNITNIRRGYTIILAAISFALWVASIEGGKVDDETGELKSQRWVLAYFINGLGFPEMNWFSDQMYHEYVLPIVFLWSVSTMAGLHMIYYCISISVTAMQSTGEEHPLFKLWKTYRTLITLMVLFQVQTISVSVLMVMWSFFVDTRDTYAISATYYECLISGFKNTSADPSRGIDACGLVRDYYDGWTRLYLFNYLLVASMTMLIYATYTEAAGKIYWSMLPVQVQDIIVAYVLPASNKIASAPSCDKDIESNKSAELAKTKPGVNWEESKEQGSPVSDRSA
jgi:hypothetical protein